MSEADNSTDGKSGYQVLARKYRPARFDDLIGQEAMVRTLRNAFEAGRIAHAWMLTGVRGVGKTTTARILARGLNYAPEDTAVDAQAGPTVDLGDIGVHCQAIMEGRHPDVIEIDAASHTGIDDIRDIIESARYSPVSARFKVYIIDEVHMLSKSAFNGLLKTLEEPPAHVKFVFATTEIRKVPVTILSRCQRFDLKRVSAAELMKHLQHIGEQEGISASEPALRIIARAAEGSVRDALSILDQAIAHSGGDVDAETVQAMLGLADRAQTIDFFDDIASGRTESALARMSALYQTGAEPLVVLTDLADFTHFVTRIKITEDAANDPGASETERVSGLEFSKTLSVRSLSTLWQILLAGIEETGRSPRPSASADMVLVRLCHAADLPTPDEALKALAEHGATAPSGAPSDTPNRQTDGNGHTGPAPGPSGQGTAEAQRGHAAITPAGGHGGPGAAMARLHDPEINPEFRPDIDPDIVSEILLEPDHDPVSPPWDENVPAPGLPVHHDPDTATTAAAGDLPSGFEALLEMARERRDRLMFRSLERQVIPIRVNDRQLEIALTPDADPGLPQQIAETLQSWTGERWIVIIGAAPPEAISAYQRRKADEARQMAAIKADPLVSHVLDVFPGAEIVSVREISGPDAAPDEDIGADRTGADAANEAKHDK